MTFYDFAAPVYGIWGSLVESRAHALAREAIRRFSGRDLLEVAVGTGTEYASLLADPRFGRCAGSDLSMGMLSRARRRCRPFEGALLCRADARALPFRTASFDSVLNCYMIDLLPQPEIPIVIREFRRVLRSDGYLVLVTMAEQKKAVQRIWMALYRYAPLLVGRCRPVDAARWLAEAGWHVELEQPVNQKGFRSSLVVARPG